MIFQVSWEALCSSTAPVSKCIYSLLQELQWQGLAIYRFLELALRRSDSETQAFKGEVWGMATEPNSFLDYYRI